MLKLDEPIKPLAQFEGSVTNEQQSGILFSLNDYLELVDFTDRCIRSDKRGAIPDHLPPILKRLNLDRDSWLITATQFEKDYNIKFSRRAGDTKTLLNHLVQPVSDQTQLVLEQPIAQKMVLRVLYLLNCN